MRRLVLAGLLCVVAGNASAQSYFEFVWSGTTGAGAPGGATINAANGDVLSMDVLLHVDAAGLSFGSISLSYDAASLLNPPTVTMCPAGCQGMTPFAPTVSALFDTVSGIRVSADEVPPLAGPTTLLLATARRALRPKAVPARLGEAL